jgi:hypothetical protein
MSMPPGRSKPASRTASSQTSALGPSGPSKSTQRSRGAIRGARARDSVKVHFANIRGLRPEFVTRTIILIVALQIHSMFPTKPHRVLPQATIFPKKPLKFSEPLFKSSLPLRASFSSGYLCSCSLSNSSLQLFSYFPPSFSSQSCVFQSYSSDLVPLDDFIGQC